MTWGEWGGFSDSRSVDKVSIPEGPSLGSRGCGPLAMGQHYREILQQERQPILAPKMSETYTECPEPPKSTSARPAAEQPSSREA